MAEQQKTKALTPAQAIGRQPVSWAISLVDSFGKKYPGLLQTATAQRCAMSAVSKVVNFMTEQGFGWDQIDTSHLSRIFIRLAIYGLDAESGDWYAYSRRNSKTGLQQFDPNPSYQGERLLRIKYSVGSYGKIQDIQALTIREGDKLAIKKDLFGKVSSVDYEPVPFNKGKILGYLGIVLFADGTTLVKEYTPDKIEEYHKANPNKSPAWEKWPEEMAHAKVIKHTAKDFKYDLPENVKKALDEVQVSDIDETAESQEASQAIDITPDEPEQIPEQATNKKQEQEPEQEAEQMEIEIPDCLKG
jgi:hypothetical protein